MSIHFDTNRSKLIVRVIQANGLINTDKDSLSDAYTRIILLPDKKKKTKRKTKVIKDSLQPVWDETFEFDVVLEKRDRVVVEAKVEEGNTPGSPFAHRVRLTLTGQRGSLNSFSSEDHNGVVGRFPVDWIEMEEGEAILQLSQRLRNTQEMTICIIYYPLNDFCLRQENNAFSSCFHCFALYQGLKKVYYIFIIDKIRHFFY